jgi:hypothetical protein
LKSSPYPNYRFAFSIRKIPEGSGKARQGFNVNSSGCNPELERAVFSTLTGLNINPANNEINLFKRYSTPLGPLGLG